MFYTAGGQQLLARPGAYSTPDGFVTTQVVLTPRFASTNVKNTKLFIPYDELSLRIPGMHRLIARVEVLHFNGLTWAIRDRSADVKILLIQK